MYEPNDSVHVISSFKTTLFSGLLRRIAEVEIDISPVSDAFWQSVHTSYCIPEVYVNNERIATLIDTGASSSVMSFKFFDTKTIQSFKLVFKKQTRIMKMANGNEVKTHGQLINVPITINNVESSVNPHIMNDLSYDLI